MRITEYKTIIDTNNLPALAKERVFNCKDVDVVKSVEDACQVFEEAFRASSLAEEHFFLLCLKTSGKCAGVFEVSHGTTDCAIVNLHDIFLRALLSGGVNIITAHNHPSGQTNPSKEDFSVCNTIKDGCRIMNVMYLDNLIIGRNENGDTECFSFRVNGLLGERTVDGNTEVRCLKK